MVVSPDVWEWPQFRLFKQLANTSGPQREALLDELFSDLADKVHPWEQLRAGLALYLFYEEFPEALTQARAEVLFHHMLQIYEEPPPRDMFTFDLPPSEEQESFFFTVRLRFEFDPGVLALELRAPRIYHKDELYSWTVHQPVLLFGDQVIKAGGSGSPLALHTRGGESKSYKITLPYIDEDQTMDLIYRATFRSPDGRLNVPYEKRRAIKVLAEDPEAPPEPEE
ncbi:MAG TPA: hypothetical protein ENH78_04950 [Phycisphaerae bacterium]|nr:hypothetical protein [Phycisphaerae bacterium]